jgi:hypothetical protein
MKPAEIYHVIVNLSLFKRPPDDGPSSETSVEGIRRLVESKLASSDVRVTRINVYRGVDAD